MPTAPMISGCLLVAPPLLLPTLFEILPQSGTLWATRWLGLHFLDFHLRGRTRHGLFWGWRPPLSTVILQFIRVLSCTGGPVPFIAE